MAACIEDQIVSLHHWTGALFGSLSMRAIHFHIEVGQFSLIGTRNAPGNYINEKALVQS